MNFAVADCDDYAWPQATCDGVAAIFVQLDYRTGGPSLPSHLYTATMLREAFAELDLLELREYEAELAEGSGYRGHSALIGKVGRSR